MAHNILKDGSYIMYGPKVIPNPFADGNNGSGGTSDLEVVEVKFVRGSVIGNVAISVAFIPNWEGLECSFGEIIFESSDNEITYPVILYKGKAYIYGEKSGGVSVAFSGDNYDIENECITGAGTITINNA